MREHGPTPSGRRWRQVVGVLGVLYVVGLLAIVVVGPPVVSALLGLSLVAATKQTLVAAGAAYLVGAIALLR